LVDLMQPLSIGYLS